MVISIDKIRIPNDEVLRYLGYKKLKIDDDFNKLLEDTIEESKKLIEPKFVCGKYKLIKNDEGVLLENTNLLLKGKDIKNHFLFAEEVVIMAATVGRIIEQKISYYEKFNLTKAIILDSCATTAVEEVCDIVEEEIRKSVYDEDKAITFRFSPGYGDLPLDIQGTFIDVLNASKLIGLTTSENFLLFPRKSATAIIGIIPKTKEKRGIQSQRCKNYDKCNFRREGHSCGN